MSNNNWDTAVIKSIFYVGFGLAIWALLTNFMPSSINDLAVTFLLFVSAYLFISILGWLIIGFPVHWLVVKFTNGSYIFYAALPVIFLVISLCGNAPVLLSLTALFQAIVFWYNLYKET